MVRMTDVILTAVLVLCLSSRGLAETILCSVCTSDSDPECETEPPSPSPCRETEEPSACKIVIEKNYEGHIIKFARACSTVSQDSKNTKGCLPINTNNVTVCYDICFTDGCNLATQTSISITVLAIVAVVLCFVL